MKLEPRSKKKLKRSYFIKLYLFFENILSYITKGWETMSKDTTTNFYLDALVNKWTRRETTCFTNVRFYSEFLDLQLSKTCSLTNALDFYVKLLISFGARYKTSYL